MKKSKWPVAVFLSKKFRRIGDFIVNMNAIILNIKNAPAVFVTPVPTTASMQTHLTDLESAEAKAKTRVIGAAADRDVKFDVCYKDLVDATGYVQSVANAAADAAAASAIIETAGLNVKINGSKIKAPIEAKNGVDSGTVDLIAKSGGKGTAYMWQSSPDAAAWIDQPLTMVAKISVTSLIPGSKMYFRVRTQSQKNGMSDWSAAVVIIVK